MTKYLFSSLLIMLVFIQACQSPKSIDEVLATVEGDSLKSHIAFLADDKLKGRLPGTPEYSMAVDYIIDQYQKLGLSTGGIDNTYLQEVPIRRGKIDESSSMMAFMVDNTPTDLVMGEDYIFLADLNATENQAEGGLVFMGYGIEAPDLMQNDYKDTDVNGKIIVVVGGAPDNFEASERAHFSNYGTKFETAIKHGAIGMLIVNKGQTTGFENVANRYRTRGNTGVIGPDGECYGRRVFGPEMKMVGFMNWNSVDKLFGVSGDELWERYEEFVGIEIEGSTVRVATKTIFEEFSSPNVIGIWEGKNKDEFVVHSAHLDHVGIGRAVAGDSIYNGAHDNASGCASLLEIARLYTKLDERPERSIAFVMVTAEEMGLLGSDYFTRFPTMPVEGIVANVNTDMPTLIAPLLSIEPLGAEHSSIMNNVKEAAEILDLEIMPDHMPEQVRFVRSDQYNFIRRGIPALHVKYGLKSLDSLSDLSEVINDYTANVYHKPSDELNDLFDFEAGEVYVRLNFLISYSIAQDPTRPKWNDDDFFQPKN